VGSRGVSKRPEIPEEEKEGEMIDMWETFVISHELLGDLGVGLLLFWGR
jgi:hypothetical protein